MDLSSPGVPPTPREREAVDALLGAEPGGGEPAVGFREARRRRANLLPGLHALQDAVGCVSRGGLEYLATRLHLPLAEAYGTATFYASFKVVDATPPPRAQVCADLACRLGGGERRAADLAARGVIVERVPCLGRCEQAPVAASDPSVPAVIRQPRSSLRLLARVGVVDPTSLADWLAHGGGEGIQRARRLGAAGVIDEVTRAGLIGRGGALFPTGRKWAAVAANPRQPRYLVCNADESEPGTFKDRVLVEQDPFAVVEGVYVASVAVGASRAWIYVRDEYPLARERLSGAIAAMRGGGWLALPGGGELEVTVFRGAGAYVCGEETALLNSIEGRRGEPRQKPPFPSDEGLFGEPTAINNVETLVNAGWIAAHGADAWRSVGVAEAPGTRLFAVSGRVARPGVYELALGASLRELLDLAGAEEPKAVLLGGAAGAFVGPDELDARLTPDGVRAIGATLGSGAVMVLGGGDDVLAEVRRLAAFFRDESCGQCVPCRVGTGRVEEWLTRRALGTALPEDAITLQDLAQAMRDASICGLGQAATSALESALRRGLV